MVNLYRSIVKQLLQCRWRAGTNGTIFRLNSSEAHPTVGIIVIGNEILKAQVKDVNCYFACKLLYEYGVKVQKILVVRDDLKEIANEVKQCSQMFNYVFTSGGIGPTHDDVTYEAVASAFDDTLHYHPAIVSIIMNRLGFGTPFPSPVYKMAYIPTKSELEFGRNDDTGEPLAFPCVKLENVYTFPGSPTFFEMSFKSLCKKLFACNESFAFTEVYINATEDTFAEALSAVAQECPSVSFGSYPEQNRYYKVRVIIESENKEDTETARKMFCDRIPTDILVNYDHSPHVNCLPKYEMMLEKYQRRSVYENSFEQFVNYYKKPEEVWIYLDDSIESVVMIHLALVTNSKLRQTNTKIRAITFESDTLNNEFLTELNKRYNIELRVLENDNTDAVKVLKKFITSGPQLRVLLVGKRSMGNKRKIYDDLAQFKGNFFTSVQVHFPLSDWTYDDVANFTYSLSLIIPQKLKEIGEK
ncbi:FAD synthase [Xylocopa sonorina]|uniref:FAD synthase n=1 Tax=Xylocopa sonorina TaxID=1818115 RepID=UPI00403AD76F